MALLEIVDEVSHLDDLHRVEAAGRLVEDQELRLMDDRLRHADPLAEAVRQGPDRILGDLAEVGDLDDVGHPPLDLRARHAAQLAREGEVVGDRHVHVERRVLGQKPDPLADLVRLGDGVDPPDLDRAGARPEIAGEDAQGRRLARSVEPEEPDGLAVVDLERDRTERSFTAVELGEIRCSNHSTSRSAMGAESLGFGKTCGGSCQAAAAPQTSDSIEDLPGPNEMFRTANCRDKPAWS